MSNDIELISVSEAAKRLKIARQSVLAAINKGHIIAQKIGNSYVIAASEIVKYKKRPSQKPGPKPRKRDA